MIELNKVYNENCIETMNKMPDDLIDLVITSPPYDNLRTYDGNNNFNFEEIANGLLRVVKQGGVVVWVVGDETVNGSESGTSFRQALYFKDIGFNLHDTMIYNKGSFQYPFPNRYHQVFEYMFVFSKGKLKTFNPLMDRKNKRSGVRTTNTKREKNGEMTKRNGCEIKKFGKRFNIWKHNIGLNNSSKDKIAHEHPAIFPEDLARDHILSWSNEDDIVYDPMCGSGTTLKMAILNKRKWIGSEIVEEYYNTCVKRISPYVYIKKIFK